MTAATAPELHRPFSYDVTWSGEAVPEKNAAATTITTVANTRRSDDTPEGYAEQLAVLRACEARDVVTQWIVDQVSRLAPSPFSAKAQELIKSYAPPDPEADRQFRELALITAYALLMLPAAALWGLVGWAASGGSRPSETIVRIGWGALVVLLAGMGLHLIRYYDAMIGKLRGRGTKRASPSWPRASSDLDFLVQVALGVLAVILGAPR
jgi:hypothetical protein